MKLREDLIALTILVLSVTLLSACGSTEKANGKALVTSKSVNAHEKPNILMVVVDDMGWYDGEKPQLFDLINDPSESNNLAKHHADVVKRMYQSVYNWHISMPADAG